MKQMITASFLALTATACTTLDPYTGEQKTSNATRGAVIGAIAGAVAGAATNTNDSGEAKENALLGAVLGAAIGGGIGNYMDRQEAELRAELEATGVRVVRTGNNIELVMPSAITFAVDQSTINPEFYRTLNSVGTILAKYNHTNILVEGHTDSTGSNEYNEMLSVRRAESVGNYLVAQSVAVPRVQALGYGEEYPIADNATDYGRSQNRRVEIQIEPVEAAFY